MHDPASYGKSALHTVLGTLLNQMASVPGIRHLIAYASAREQELMAALEALSFVSAGTQRDALYHRGQYEPLHLFTYRISE
jgi:RimJ/RimL family protein N-acetyltransferase